MYFHFSRSLFCLFVCLFVCFSFRVLRVSGLEPTQGLLGVQNEEDPGKQQVTRLQKCWKMAAGFVID